MSQRRRASGRSPRSDNSSRTAYRDDTHDRVATTTTNSASPLLFRLFEACKKHRTQCHNETGVLFDQEEPLPEKCHRDLKSLALLLPQVEEAYQDSNRDPHASSISNMCQFYWLVLEGGFCPHSHFLFNWGEDLRAIFIRVHQLYRHLLSRCVVQDIVDKTAKKNASKQDKPTSTLLEICTTIAHLLNLIPKFRIQKAIICDLVALAFDLSTIIEAKLLEKARDEGRDLDSIEVDLFPESLTHICGDAALDSTLRISSTVEVLVIQTGTLTILETLLKLQKTKRTKEVETRAIGSHDGLTAASVDCYFFNAMDDDDLISTFFAAIKHALLWSPNPTPDTSMMGSSKEKDMVWAFSLRSKAAALSGMTMLLHDFKCGEELMCNTVIELSRLVSMAVIEYFRSVSTVPRECFSIKREKAAYVKLLSKMVCDTILFPPERGDDNRFSEMLWTIRSQALPLMLDCVAMLVKHNSDGGECNEIQSPMKWTQEENALRTLVLRTIHCSIYTESPSSCNGASLSLHAANHCAAGGLYPEFFSLMNEIDLSNVVIAILSKLMWDADSSSGNGLRDIAKACRIASVDYSPRDFETSVDGDGSGSGEQTPSGSKRKRQSESQQGSRTTQLTQLQIERSPKRRRSLESTMSTPLSVSDGGTTVETGTSPQVASRSLESCLTETFSAALESGTTITTNLEKLTAGATMDQSEGLVHDSFLSSAVLAVTSASRLVLDILLKFSKSHSAIQDQKGEFRELVDIFEFLCQIFRPLKHLSVAFLSADASTAGDFGSNAQTTRALLIGFGIHSHFALAALLSSVSIQLPHSTGDLNVVVDVISYLALCTWENTFSSVMEKTASMNASSEISITGSHNENKSSHHGCYCDHWLDIGRSFPSNNISPLSTLSITPCLCRFLIGDRRNLFRKAEHEDAVCCTSRRLGTRHPSAGADFLDACTRLLLDALPTQFAYTLLSCLRPLVTGDPRCDNVAQELKLVNVGADRTVNLVSRILGSAARSQSKPAESFATEAVSVLPVLVFSLIAPTLANSSEGSSSRPSIAGEESLKSEGLGNSLQSIQQLLLFLTSPRPVSVDSSFTSALGHLQAFLEPTEVSDLPTENVLSFRFSFSAPVSICDLITYAFSNSYGSDSRIILSARGDPDQAKFLDSIRFSLLSTRLSQNASILPPAARLQVWKCMTWTCLHSRRSDFQNRVIDLDRMVRVATEHSSLPQQEPIVDEDVVPVNPFLSATLWVLKTAFADPDTALRDAAARDIGRVVLGRSSHLLHCLFTTDDEWRFLSRCSSQPSNSVSQDPSTPAVARFFQVIDALMYQYCSSSSSQSQTSATKDAAAPASDGEAVTSPCHSDQRDRSAVYALSSLCQHADTKTACGISVFESALIRLIRFWAAAEDSKEENMTDEDANISIPSVAFAELSRLNRHRPLRTAILSSQSRERAMPAIFSCILLPNGSPITENGDQQDFDCFAPEQRERQYRLLIAFVQSFLLSASHDVGFGGDGGSARDNQCLLQVLFFVDEVFPDVLPALVVQQQYEALCMVTGFRLFLLGEKRRIQRMATNEGNLDSHHRDLLVGQLLSEPSVLKSRLKATGVKESKKELEENAKLICVSPGHLHHILRRLLLHSGGEPLIFFLLTVVKGKMTLHRLVENARLKLLRTLVMDLGRDRLFESETSVDMKAVLDSPVVQAIRKCAVVMEHDAPKPEGKQTQSGLSLSDRCSSPLGSLAGGLPAEYESMQAVRNWITSKFMFLLVNVCQHRWKFRSAPERIEAIRCLRAILYFLKAPDSAQYIPQIMASINMAMSDDSCGSDIFLLRRLAVQSLSHFVRLVVGHEVRAIGPNLTPIVVSMFPVLSPVDNRNEGNFRYFQEATNAAVDLLEWLSQGQLGKDLAPFFSEIPFLPPTPRLDKVRSALKANGVNFDNLLVLSATPGTATQGLTSSGSGSDGALHFSPYLEAALHNRLGMLTQLLSHENVSVRRVVLRYVTDLISANRQLWYRVIKNHNGTSAQRQLTKDFSVAGASAGPTGNVESLIGAFLTRCIFEDDGEARLLIATALGELGAIDFMRIEDINPAPTTELHSDSSWRLSNPPWQSSRTSLRYESRLVSKHLVVALKASPTSIDQHKIAFAIQQLLVLLDASGSREIESSTATHSRGGSMGSEDISKGGRGTMSPWLVDMLKREGVLEIIEPFWLTSFQQSERPQSREPPFFRTSVSYFQWLSRWCGFMIERSHKNAASCWRETFFACRTAIKSTAGISVAEFLFPLLVLDSLCFGDELDERVALQELTESLTFNTEDDISLFVASMNKGERQKAVSSSFMVIDILEQWAESETEARHKGSKASAEGRKRLDLKSTSKTDDTNWPSDLSISKIDDTLKAIPLSLRARAAAAVGMHARALRLLEMAGRLSVVDIIFDRPNEPRRKDKTGRSKAPQRPIGAHLVEGIDLGLLKEILGELDDCFTMKAVGQDSCMRELLTQAKDSIREKVAMGDWVGAIQDYERALQLDVERRETPKLRRGMLNCLLELGQFESVLNQVTGIINPRAGGWGSDVSLASSEDSGTIPSAVEAAWRLGRWSVLENLAGYEGKDAEEMYQVFVGGAMLGLVRKAVSDVSEAVKGARNAVMTDLSSFARESYSRCYNHLLRLHCLREIENACVTLCSPEAATQKTDSISVPQIPVSSLADACEWDARLDVVSSDGASAIVNVRLALARLAGDSDLEGRLYLRIGKSARKSGLYNIAENSLAQADASFRRLNAQTIDATCLGVTGDSTSSVRMQLAKLQHVQGESASALQILGQDDILHLIGLDDDSLRVQVAEIEMASSQSLGGLQGGDIECLSRFAKRLLQSTQWMAEAGLKGGAEVVERFRLVKRLCPKLEKASFHFAKHVDSLLECRLSALANQINANADDVAARSRLFYMDTSCQKYLLLAIQQYGEALTLGSKHVYQNLPRLLTLWFDFMSIDGNEFVPSIGSSSGGRGHPAAADLGIDRFLNFQGDVNQVMHGILKSVPSQSLYTAMPQLISRVSHRNPDTVRLVIFALVRVLCKFPTRAMWALAWLRNSVSQERASIGEKLFKDAQRSFAKTDRKHHDLLVASKSLFKYFIDLSKYQPKDQNQKTCNIRSWKGEVELMEFVPPIQAALTVLQPDVHKTHNRDVFSALIPRMRAFSSQIQIMTSKARPKKLKAYAVPAKHLKSPRKQTSAALAKGRQPEDIGEMHFLVKQEAKGDLRKDARVQDLNNVINRLLATSSCSSVGTSSKQRRLLRLRTFSVVCVSEECGVLEWVPNTDSLRNLVRVSYNPQAEQFSIRRRGRRISNLTDVNLRKSFESCQTLYKTTGNLVRAAAMFEEQCLRPYPPLFYWWFIQNFLDPHSWYEARTRFATSVAAWSAVGHVLGLGDRHSENVLVDTSSGDCVHVDFDCIFDKGLNLPQPEIVPFRLTQNMLDAFGPTGADGTFRGSLTTAMSTLRANRDTLLSVLEPFLKDPVIDWKRHRSQQKGNDKSQGSRETKAAKRSMTTIDGRLKGIYNLRVPPARRVRRTDGRENHDDISHLIPLSVEGQVQKMIAEATSSENLVQIYVGWMPWL